MLNFLTKALTWYVATTHFYGSVNDCGGSDALFQINSVSLSPENPIPGVDVSLTLEYSVPAGLTVTDGQVEYDVTYNYIPFSPSYEPLCQNIPCPLGSGTYKNTSTSEWPASVSGLLVSKMKWLDYTGSLLLCLEIVGQTGSLDSVALVPMMPAGAVVEYRRPMGRLLTEMFRYLRGLRGTAAGAAIAYRDML